MIKYIYRKINYYLENKRIVAFKNAMQYCGSNVEIDSSLILSFPERLIIEDLVYIGPRATINAIGKVVIKRGVIIGPNLFIHSANHNYKNAKYLPYDEQHIFKAVTISENVWIGANVSISPGVFVGEGAIIALGSVVVKDVPPFAIVGGNPAKIISYRDQDVYMKLKKEDLLYLKAKSRGEISPDYFTGYED